MRTVCQTCFATVQEVDRDNHSAWHRAIVARLDRMDRRIEVSQYAATTALENKP